MFVLEKSFIERRITLEYSIQQLSREHWENCKLYFPIESNSCYDVSVCPKEGGYTISLDCKPLIPARKIDYPIELFSSYFEHQEVYGVVQDNQLLAVIEIAKEDWNQRLRITELAVDVSLRRQKIATALMNLAKKRARELNCRSIVLEAQTWNEVALGFYFSQGFKLCGLDTNCYSNHDIEDQNVRLELAFVQE